MVREIPETIEGCVGSGRVSIIAGRFVENMDLSNFVWWRCRLSFTAPRGFRFSLVALTCKALT
jgi:hypothetical protein